MNRNKNNAKIKLGTRISKYKGALVVGGFIGTVLIALYPIFIYPYFNIEQYKKSQRVNRQGIRREEIQPGNMRVWSDPFTPRDEK